MSISYADILDNPADLVKESIRRSFKTKSSPDTPLAFVLSPMYGIAGNEANASGGDPFSVSGARIAKYKFRAQIIDENSQHIILPDPCELATAKSPADAASLITLFTEVLIFDEPNSGQVASVNVGDMVQIKLKRSADGESDDLQVAEFVKIISRANSPTNPLAKSQCQSLVDAFPSAQTHTYSGGSFGRPKIAEYTGKFGTHQTVTNGQFPEALQVYVDTTYVIGKNRQEKLCADVVEDFNNLAAAYYQRFKKKLVVNSGYRPFETQLRIKQEFTAKGRGRFAATPGTSPHGWGVAFDWNSGGYGTTRYKWMLANAPRFGFTNPAWARQGGSLPEPWHFEYIKKGNIIQNIRRSKASDGK